MQQKITACYFLYSLKIDNGSIIFSSVLYEPFSLTVQETLFGIYLFSC